MVKRKRYGPISDARAVAREQMVLNQFNPSKARGSAWSRERYGDTWGLATSDQRAARYNDMFRGRGDYKSWLGGLARGGGAALGYGFGGVKGMARGMNLGSAFIS